MNVEISHTLYPVITKHSFRYILEVNRRRYYHLLLKHYCVYVPFQTQTKLLLDHLLPINIPSLPNLEAHQSQLFCLQPP